MYSTIHAIQTYVHVHRLCIYILYVQQQLFFKLPRVVIGDSGLYAGQCRKAWPPIH